MNMNQIINVFPIVVLGCALLPTSYKQGKIFLGVMALFALLYYVIVNDLPVFIALSLLILISLITVVMLSCTLDQYFGD